MAQSRLMKDGLGRAAIDRMAGSVHEVYPGFDIEGFRTQAIKGLNRLELKQRVHHIIDVLAGFLPADFRKTAEILNQVPGVWDYGDKKDALRGFAAWPLIDYVSVHGLEHPALGLSTLKVLTPLFSAEFAIRPFIRHHREMTLAQLGKWTRDSNHHVRRLVSEGTRPRLPWGMRLSEFIADPAPVIRLLESLKDDDSEYVRRSVANNLNDISRDHASLVIQVGRQWLKGAGAERQWIVRHAARTLVKEGHPAAFALLGHETRPRIEISSFRLKPRRIRLGQSLEISFQLHSRSRRQQSLVLDYKIHFVRANGSLGSKVFKLRNILLGPGEVIGLQKAHAIRPITTRKYYPGRHIVELMVNGLSCATASFQLEI